MPKHNPYAMAKRKKPRFRTVEVPQTVFFTGAIKNHPTHKPGSDHHMYHFMSGNEVIAVMDTELEEIYIVPTRDDTTHEVFSRMCRRDGIPYIDESREFQIAVPIKFYAETAKQAGVMNHYEYALKIEQILIEKWQEYKNNGFSNQTH